MQCLWQFLFHFTDSVNSRNLACQKQLFTVNFKCFKEAFNHVRGIWPFNIENWFERMLSPTLVWLVFKIKNTVCLVVKIWSKFRLILTYIEMFMNKLTCALLNKLNIYLSVYLFNDVMTHILPWNWFWDTRLSLLSHFNQLFSYKTTIFE